MITYTSFSQRFSAGIVDGLVMLPISFVSLLLFDLDEPGSLLAFEIISAAVYYSYSIGMHYRYGQTLGKMALSIKVIHANGSNMRITLGQAVLRDAVPLLCDVFIFTSAIISIFSTGKYSDEYFAWPLAIWFLLEMITMLTNHKRRAIHDFIASTVVIEHMREKQMAGDMQSES